MSDRRKTELSTVTDEGILGAVWWYLRESLSNIYGTLKINSDYSRITYRMPVVLFNIFTRLRLCSYDFVPNYFLSRKFDEIYLFISYCEK